MREKNTLLDFMRTKVWINYLHEKTGASGRTDMNRVLFGSVIEADEKDYKFYDIRFDRYENRETIAEIGIREQVENTTKGKGSYEVYESGPYENGKATDLWYVFGTDFSKLREIIDTTFSKVADMRKRGVASDKRLEEVLIHFAKKENWDLIDFSDPKKHPSKNIVVDAFENGYFKPTLKSLVGAMAMYREMLRNDTHMAQMEYLMKGLLAEPYSAVLTKHGIYDDFILAFTQLELYDLLLRNDEAGALKLLLNLKDEHKLS